MWGNNYNTDTLNRNIEAEMHELITDDEWYLMQRNKKRRERSCPSPERKREVLNRDNYKCTQCGEIEGLQVHHIIPRSQNGSHEANNLITLCNICHTSAHKGENVQNLMVKMLNYQLNNNQFSEILIRFVR